MAACNNYGSHCQVIERRANSRRSWQIIDAFDVISYTLILNDKGNNVAQLQNMNGCSDSQTLSVTKYTELAEVLWQSTMSTISTVGVGGCRM